MAESTHQDDARVAALCHRLGRLWPDHGVDIWEDDVPPEKLQECKLTLIGKILSNPTINFPAFQSTLRRVWRNDYVQISTREDGFYIFKFNTEGEKQRVLDNGHWLFGHHLIILKPWLPNTPLHCYDFTTCVFWVQIYGLPLERCTENMITRAVRQIGKVQEVRIEGTDNSSAKSVRVKVELNLQEPLQSGKLIKVDGKHIWLDFRYERLSHYCYSCGLLGHYAMYCNDIPYDAAKLEESDSLSYGKWLRAEVNQHSPFWFAFYDQNFNQGNVEEVVPETQQQLPPLLLPAPPSPQQPSAIVENTAEHSSVILQPSPPVDLKQKSIMFNQPMLPHNAAEDSSTCKKIKTPRSVSKSSPLKKTKRYNPYGISSNVNVVLDESTLLDTPIISTEGVGTWAEVACLKKPPQDK